MHSRRHAWAARSGLWMLVLCVSSTQAGEYWQCFARIMGFSYSDGYHARPGCGATLGDHWAACPYGDPMPTHAVPYRPPLAPQAPTYTRPMIVPPPVQPTWAVPPDEPAATSDYAGAAYFRAPPAGYRAMTAPPPAVAYPSDRVATYPRTIYPPRLPTDTTPAAYLATPVHRVLR